MFVDPCHFTSLLASYKRKFSLLFVFRLYNGNPVGQQFGPKCARGDRIGCGIHSENTEAGFTTVFFTKNGKEVNIQMFSSFLLSFFVLLHLSCCFFNSGWSSGSSGVGRGAVPCSGDALHGGGGQSRPAGRVVFGGGWQHDDGWQPWGWLGAALRRQG